MLEPFPVAVICEVMGVPAADREQMHAWAARIVSTKGGAEASAEAKKGMFGWIADTVRAHADSEGDDVYSLIGSAVRRGQISRAEAVGLAAPLQIGGEAVTHQLRRCCTCCSPGPS